MAGARPFPTKIKARAHTDFCELVVLADTRVFHAILLQRNVQAVPRLPQSKSAAAFFPPAGSTVRDGVTEAEVSEDFFGSATSLVLAVIMLDL